MKNLISYLVVILLSFNLFSCVTTIKHKGYSIDKEDLVLLKPDSSTQEDVIRTLGSPSLKSNLGNETWYYISSIESKIAFFKSKPETRTIIAINFSPMKKITMITEYSEKDSQILSVNKEYTTTKGDDKGVLKELFGNLGKYNKDNKNSKRPRDVSRSGVPY